MPTTEYKSEIIFKPRPETIEAKLNELAADDWDLVSALPQQGGDLVIILRRGPHV